MPDPTPRRGPPALAPLLTCEGYVWKYSIIPPRGPKDDLYFTFTISSKKNEAQDLLEFRLGRKIRSEVIDQDSQQKLWAISYSSISMAIIATLKDALISGTKVIVRYHRWKPADRPREITQIRWVELIKE